MCKVTKSIWVTIGLVLLGGSLLVVGQTTQTPKTEEPSAAQRPFFIGLYSPGSAWVQGKSALEQPFLDEHRSFMSKLEAEGQLLIGGAFGKKPGGMAIYRFESLAAAEKLLRDDPIVAKGVFVLDVQPFIPTVYGCVRSKASVQGKTHGE